MSNRLARAALALATLGACTGDGGRGGSGGGPIVANARIAVPRPGPPGEWPMPGGDYSNSRYSELADITPANAKQLQVSWALSTGVLRGHEDCKAALPGLPGIATSDAASTGIVGFRGASPALGIHASASLSQIASAYDDVTRDHELFPEGQADADLQQVDLRAVNSWRLTLGDVPSPEMLEVQLVNAVAPFILASKLKPLMLRERTDDKHIVNVSAVEGQFGRWTKTDKHPHTNMAKAALNMMTLTSAPDYRKGNLYMNAVDTGWVTDEDPHVHAERKRQERDFSPPLDIVDGAARVVDPVLDSMRTGQLVSGLFLKDYKPTRW